LSSSYKARASAIFDLNKERAQRKLQLNKLEEIRNDAYDCAKSYENRMKQYHDKHILRKVFSPREKILMDNSRLHLFPRKLRNGHALLLYVLFIHMGSLKLRILKMVLFLK